MGLWFGSGRVTASGVVWERWSPFLLGYMSLAGVQKGIEIPVFSYGRYLTGG